MTDASYLLEQLPPPTKLKVFVDQRVFPMAINAAANVEMLLERAAVGARERPVRALGLAVGAGFLISMMLTRRRA